jgi:hypothetical protein
MPSRHYLLAELEDNRRKNEEEGVEVLGWQPADPADVTGYDPYDNPGTSEAPRKRGDLKQRGSSSG